MRTKVFENDYVGIRINSVAEIMQYSALPNFAICDEYGEYFDECVRGEDNIERESQPRTRYRSEFYRLSAREERFMQPFTFRVVKLFHVLPLPCKATSELDNGCTR